MQAIYLGMRHRRLPPDGSPDAATCDPSRLGELPADDGRAGGEVAAAV